MHPPDPIDGHARGEWVLPAGEPTRQAETVARQRGIERRQADGVSRGTSSRGASYAPRASRCAGRGARHLLHHHDFADPVATGGCLLGEAAEAPARCRLARADTRARRKYSNTSPAGVGYLAAGHFERRQRDVEDLQVVDEPVLEAAVAEPGAERQRRLLGEVVACRLLYVMSLYRWSRTTSVASGAPLR